MIISFSKVYKINFIFDQTLILNGKPIQNSSERKFLSITIEKTPYWSCHISKLLVDLLFTSNLQIVFRLSVFASKRNLTMLYFTLIHSTIFYDIQSWSSTPTNHVNKLIKFEKKNCANINHEPFCHSLKEIFNKCNIVTADKIYKYKSLIKVHSHFHSFSSTTSFSQYLIRHLLHSLSAAFYSAAAGQQTSKFMTSAPWNKLADIKK